MPAVCLTQPSTPARTSLQAQPATSRLMLAFSHGSADAFSALFSRYQQPVFGFYRRRVADPGQTKS